MDAIKIKTRLYLALTSDDTGCKYKLSFTSDNNEYAIFAKTSNYYLSESELWHF